MKNAPNGFWRTKDGAILKIKEMEDSHLVNAMNLLKRYSAAYHKTTELQLTWMWARVGVDTEAEYQLENELHAMEEMCDEDFLPRKFFELQREASKRGIVKDDDLIYSDEVTL